METVLALEPLITYPNSGGGALTATDMNRDGKLDLITLSSSAISIRLGAGDGTFGEESTYATGLNPQWVLADDFNHDGALDVAIVNSGTTAGGGSLGVRIGVGDGTLGP